MTHFLVERINDSDRSVYIGFTKDAWYTDKENAIMHKWSKGKHADSIEDGEKKIIMIRREQDWESKADKTAKEWKEQWNDPNLEKRYDTLLSVQRKQRTWLSQPDFQLSSIGK